MLEALGLGLLGASSVLLAGLLACWVTVVLTNSLMPFAFELGRR